MDVQKLRRSENPSATPARAASSGERRYTEEELAQILERAAERQEGVPQGAPRYSLADIQEIAAGAGIAPEHVASVAAALRDRRSARGGGPLGAPYRFRFEEPVEGEVADDVVAELLDLVRRELGLQGTVSEALGSVQWEAQDPMGTTSVSVTRRGGRTIVGVLSARTDAAGVAATLGGVAAFGASIALSLTLIGAAGVVGPVAVLAGVAGGGGGTWLATRATWRRFARRAGEHAEGLGWTLIAAARQAVEDGRVRGAPDGG